MTRRYGKRGDPLEKVVQHDIIDALAKVGARSWSIGTTRSQGRDCPHCGQFVPNTDRGTRQSEGLCDVISFVPLPPYSDPCRPSAGTRTVLLFVEAKRGGNSMSLEQGEFLHQALAVGPPVHHVTGGLDEVLAWLQKMGRVKASA
jgi:hypothetical protein